MADIQKLRLFLGTGLLGTGILYGIINAIIGLPGVLSDLQSWGRWIPSPA